MNTSQPPSPERAPIPSPQSTAVCPNISHWSGSLGAQIKYSLGWRKTDQERGKKEGESMHGLHHLYAKGRTETYTWVSEPCALN